MRPDTEKTAGRPLENRPRRLTRRKAIALGGTVLGSLVSGCLGSRTDDSVPVQEATVTLDNRSDESHVFHLAVESATGLGEWHSRTVAGNSTERLTVSLADGDRPYTAHGVVNDRTVRASPITEPESETDIETVCLRLELRYDGDELDLNQNMDSIRC